MPDITMCTGEGCIIKNTCKRFTATPNEYRQSFFTNPPFTVIKGYFGCDMYWGITQDSIMRILEEACSGKV